MKIQLLLLNTISSTNNNRIRGVNLGGWLVLEPWITPSLFEQFVHRSEKAVDEFTFTKVLGKVEAKRQLENHWKTWVTKHDFIQLKAAGITHIRIPIGYWSLNVEHWEPWVTGSFDYFFKGLIWARETGLKVVIDLHGAPGSQNGFDNSGIRGEIGWFKSEYNIQRVMDVLLKLTDLTKAKEWEGTLDSIELINEPANWGLDVGRLRKFYDDTYHAIRRINPDIGVIFHDAFLDLSKWKDYSQYKNIQIDTHMYQVFTVDFNKMSPANHLKTSCERKGLQDLNSSGIKTIVGEWSLATNDCAKWLNGFDRGTRYEGTWDNKESKPVCPNCTCNDKNTLSAYSKDHINFLKNFARNQIGTFEKAGSGWYFWNFKTEQAPEWNFLLAVREGWINLHRQISPSCLS